MKKHRDIVPNMLQNIRNGKPTEKVAINIVARAYGKKHSIPTPINDKIGEIIEKGETGELKT